MCACVSQKGTALGQRARGVWRVRAHHCDAATARCVCLCEACARHGLAKGVAFALGRLGFRWCGWCPCRVHVLGQGMVQVAEFTLVAVVARPQRAGGGFGTRVRASGKPEQGTTVGQG